MGWIRHHAIIVTGCDEAIEESHELALKLLESWEDEPFDPQPVVGPLSDECMNNYRSFSVYPDGSKEGWSTSNAGDDFRDKLIAGLHEWCDWVEVEYGEVEEPRVTRSDVRPTESKEE